jgi:hypothetical protein
MEGSGRGQIHCTPGICLEELRETTKPQDSLSPGRGLNSEPSRYECFINCFIRHWLTNPNLENLLQGDLNFCSSVSILNAVVIVAQPGLTVLT